MAFATSCTSAFGKLSVTSLGCVLPVKGRCGAVNSCVPGYTADVSGADAGAAAGAGGGPSAKAASVSKNAQSAATIRRRFICLSLVVVIAVVAAVTLCVGAVGSAHLRGACRRLWRSDVNS